MHILVFKTSVANPQELMVAKSFLDSCDTIEEWNFDLDDCDNILRVVTPYNLAEFIITHLLQRQIICQELL